MIKTGNQRKNHSRIYHTDFEVMSEFQRQNLGYFSPIDIGGKIWGSETNSRANLRDEPKLPLNVGVPSRGVLGSAKLWNILVFRIIDGQRYR